MCYTFGTSKGKTSSSAQVGTPWNEADLDQWVMHADRAWEAHKADCKRLPFQSHTENGNQRQ